MKPLSLLKTLVSAALRAVPASAPAAVSCSSAVLSTVAACGMIENGNALAPVNDITHVFYGAKAFGEAASTWSARNLLRYTLPAILWNTFALWGWAVIHEMLSRRSRGGSLERSVLWGVLVSMLAYVVDYKLVSARWTPGIEAHLSPRSLFAAYVALALGLALVPARGE